MRLLISSGCATGFPFRGPPGQLTWWCSRGGTRFVAASNGCGETISAEVVLTILATEPGPDDEGLLVYPVPATRQITITLSAESVGSSVPSLRLTDVRGLTVQTATLLREGKFYQAVLDVGDLPGGTFFVVVADDRTQRVRVKRIRKQ